MQPVGMLDTWHRVGHLLTRRRDRDNLLYCRVEAGTVVSPVNDGSYVEVFEADRAVFEPSTEVVHLMELKT